MLDRINIISFLPDQVAASRQVMPEVGASLIVNMGSNAADKLLRSAYTQTGDFGGAYSPNHNYPAEGIRAMQHRGILVNLWTVDGAEEMLSAAKKGMAFLTTNTSQYRLIIDLETEKMDSDDIFSKE